MLTSNQDKGINDLQFEAVYNEFYSPIFRYLTRYIGASEAEDLTQDVFFRINKALHTFNHQSKLSTWIYRIATNAAIDKMRGSRNGLEKSECIMEVEKTAQEPSLACHSHSTEDYLVRKEMFECINGYISVLPENYQSVLVLCDLEGMKNSEVAEILGLSISTVKARLHRGRAKLKQILSENCHLYQAEGTGSLACEPKGVFPKLKKL